MKRSIFLLSVLFLVVILSAALVGLASCGKEEPEATPTPAEVVAAQPVKMTVTGDLVYARRGPNAESEQIGALELGDQVDILATSMDGAWHRICCVAGEEAWMSAEFLAPLEEAPAEPTPESATPTPAPAAQAQPTTDGVNARKGPGTGYGKVGLVYSSDSLAVTGKNEDGSWYQLCCVNGETAWVSGNFLHLSGETANIPVVEAPPLTGDTQADNPAADAGPGSTGRVSVGNVVPEVDNPPPGAYWGLCGLDVNRPVRAVPPAQPAISGNVNPLTGLTTDPALLQRRILLVRYGNEPAIKQYYGLGSADLVFEELMDSLNTTRFTSVWLAGDAPMVGPLRSYRATSIQLAQMYNAPLASSGAVGPNQVIAYRSGVEDLDWRCYTQPYFMNPNVASDDWQNRAVSSIVKLRGYIESAGLNQPPVVRAFAFSDSPPGGSAGNSVVIPYVNRGYYEAEWRYDAGSGRYLRFQGTSRFPLTDGNSGQQVTAANVVVLYVQHDLTDIVEDSLGSLSVRTYLTGQEGRATILRDGVAIEGRWRVPNAWNNLELVDGSGNPLPLKPGNTWFQIVPPSYNVTVQ